MRIPRIVLAGTHSGVGKTTLATGLMAALKRRRRPVQGYKVGPDYIDPSYHTAATDRPSRNLDRWLLGDHLNSSFRQSAKYSWAVIEGVMGMFDGMSGTPGYGSTADVAKLLKSPIVLIVDASAMSRSVAALVHGFKTYDPEVSLQGVILNRVKSSAQENILSEALAELGMPILGVLPKEISMQLPERHLGLIPVGEGGLLSGYIESLSDFVTEYVDLEKIEMIMQNAPELEETVETVSELGSGSAKRNFFRLGLAWDEAFLFYYRDALDLAERYHAAVIPFSPLHDSSLPESLDGIFLGGGFPELHLPELSANTSFLNSLRNFAAGGKPIYAECGGYMYLGNSIKDFEGREYPLAGLIPMKAEMTKRLQGIGYRRGVFLDDTFLGPRGTEVQGHEFHYSKVTFDSEVPAAYRLFKGEQNKRTEGYARDNLFASYLHLNFAGQPELLEHWFNSARRRKGA